ncbi:phospholipase A2 [Streptomyces sp. NPDC013457]|uniref:phospholipase A2 n=1 Tax=Streptomyces sp. NPDC013457 TaxID=3364866 RepID=UPI0036F8C747
MKSLLRRRTGAATTEGRTGRGGRMVSLALVTALGVGGLAWAGTTGVDDPAGTTTRRPDTVAHVNASGSPSKVSSLAASGRTVYALAEDGSAVYEAADHGVWKKIGGEARAIYAGGAGLFATSSVDGSIYRYDTEQSKWFFTGGPATKFAVGADRLYSLAGDGSVNAWGSGGWQRIGGPAKDIHAGRAGVFMTTLDGNVHRYHQGQWTQIGGPGAEFVVGTRSLYGLAPDRLSVHEWTQHGGWQRISGPAEHIYGGEGRVLKVSKETGDVYRYSVLFRKWTKIGGPGSTFVSSTDDVYGVSPDRSAVFKHVSDRTWKKTAGTVESSSVTKEQKLARVRAFMQLGQQSFNDWAAARGDALVNNNPDIHGFNWDADKCTKAPDQPGADFRAACTRHDFGYRNYRALLGEHGMRFGVPGVTGLGADSPKAQTDAVFLQDMKKECNRPLGSGRYVQAKPAFQIAACEAVAQQYYAAVTVLG